jgi:L-rhamnose mutarotase
MNRHVLTVNLKSDPESVETYTRYHRAVWPEVQASLRRVGVQQMDIYLLGHRLVMVVEMREGLDYRTAFDSHVSSSQRVAEWERLMKSLQEPSADARAGEWWALMEPVFHLGQGTEAHGSTETQPGSDARQPLIGPEEPAIAHVADPSRWS